jgi:hypothetical protein
MIAVIIPYDGDARGPSTGARYLVQYRRQADWYERVPLWKLRESEEAQAKDGGTCCTCRRKFPSEDLMSCDACSHQACDDCMAWRIINDYEYWFCPCCLDRMVPAPPPPLPPGLPPTQQPLGDGGAEGVATSPYIVGTLDAGSDDVVAVDAAGPPVVVKIPTKGGGNGGRPRVKAKAKCRPAGGGYAY